MAYVGLDGGDDGMLAVTAAVAERCGARVIGVATRQPVEMMYGAGRMTGELIELDRREIHKALGEAESRFRAALAGKVPHVEWRGAMCVGPLADYVACEARAADLIVTQPDIGVGFANGPTRMSVGDLVMSAGRPVLVVPYGVRTLDLDHVVVAWKDTREARRAARDALPLLKVAGRVTVVEIADEDRLDEARARLDDVVAWLTTHGVSAAAEPVGQSSLDAVRLDDVAGDKHAGLMVAGAYGHTRMLEWILGGVTCDLLLHPVRCTLVSH
jgi:nucleotide-binding universal stress UspA family protein